MKKQQKVIDKIDWTLVLILFLFLIISCISISSAQTSAQYKGNFVLQQGVWYVIGFTIIGMAIILDPSQYRKLSYYFYGFGILLLVGLLVAPHCIDTGCLVPKRNGATSWYVLPGLGQIQPSEFMKTFLILAVSNIIASHNEKVTVKTTKTDLFLLLKIGLITALPLALILLQPDLGTGLVLIAIVAGLVLISGITWKIILPLYTSILTIGGTVLYFVIWAPETLVKYLPVKAYQFDRIYAWLYPENYPEESWHLLLSMSAIGSGEVSGKGFFNKEVYLPERHTDFIFSVIGEEFGFVGASIVICLYFFLIYHLTKTAIFTKNPFNSYVCAGIICMITFHVFQNIGMTIQVLPITGIPLPFISYGGSSLMGNMLALGLIFSIRFYHRDYMFSSEN